MITVEIELTIIIISAIILLSYIIDVFFIHGFFMIITIIFAVILGALLCYGIGKAIYTLYRKATYRFQDKILNRSKAIMIYLKKKECVKKPSVFYSGMIPDDQIIPSTSSVLSNLPEDYTLLHDMYYVSQRLNGRVLKMDYILVSKYGVIVLEVPKKTKRDVINLYKEDLKQRYSDDGFNIQHSKNRSQHIEDLLSTELDMPVNVLSVLSFDSKVIFYLNDFEYGKRGDLYIAETNTIAATSYLLENVIRSRNKIVYDNETISKIIDILKSKATQAEKDINSHVRILEMKPRQIPKSEEDIHCLKCIGADIMKYSNSSVEDRIRKAIEKQSNMKKSFLTNTKCPNDKPENTKSIIQTLPADYTVLTDLCYKTAAKKIDHLIISKYGVYVVYVPPFYGEMWFHSSPEESLFYCVKHGHIGYPVYNNLPKCQLVENILLQELGKDIKTKSIISFDKKSDFILNPNACNIIPDKKGDLYIPDKNTIITNAYLLRYVLLSLNQTIVFDDDTVNDIVLALNPKRASK